MDTILPEASKHFNSPVAFALKRLLVLSEFHRLALLPYGLLQAQELSGLNWRRGKVTCSTRNLRKEDFRESNRRICENEGT